MTRTVVAAMLGAGLTAAAAHADVRVPINAAGTGGPGEPLGHITLTQAGDGTLIKPELKGLPPGLHGFHLHENDSCAPGKENGQPLPAGAAGDHYDPAEHGHHRGPYDGTGHHGDLPVLYADPLGAITVPVLAPNVALHDFADRALVIHAGADTYADQPPLGGGGARIACGVVPK